MKDSFLIVAVFITTVPMAGGDIRGLATAADGVSAASAAGVFRTTRETRYSSTTRVGRPKSHR